MPSGSYMQVFVRCPFYKHDDGKRRITCEGIVEESSLVLSFNGTADYRQHLELFCCGRYDCCEVHRMLLDKYDEED